MKKLSLLAVLACCGMLVYAQKTKQTVDKRLTGIDTALSRLLKDWNAPGFAVAVVEKDKVIYSKGFGYSDYEAKKPVTPNTLFAIGSCTKAFTSSLLGILEKEGKLSLNKKVTEYLPTLQFFNNEMNNGVTSIDLMSHRTGLPRHDFSWYLFTTKSRDSLIERVQYLEPSATLRERWQYNNFMFLVQGVLAEKLTGKSWEANIRERIFTPLGMSRSNLSVDDLPKDNDAAIGYRLKNDSINSSVTEMANWVITWINDGKFEGKEVLPAGYITKAFSSHMSTGGGYPGKTNPDIYFSDYGLGWSLSSYRGHYRVDHGGNIDGFSANTSFFPADSIGVIVLTNQNGSPIPALARNIIIDKLFGLKYINWSGDRKKELEKSKKEAKEAEGTKQSSRVTGTKPSHGLKEYEGNFNHPGYGDAGVYWRNDSLFSNMGKDSVWLRHYHYDVFEIKGFDRQDGLDTTEGGTKINFRTGEDGKISGFTASLEPNVKPIEFSYKPKARPLTRQELEKYTGEYSLAGMTAKVYLKSEILYVFVPGQPEYETVYTGDHTFKLKVLDGYSVKFDVSGNEANALTFIQPNGNFKAVKKK
ncbi:MAG: serine hydrolase [Chitinophagaceae bacterium]|nr:serine hydrolase [Chitinophagaceae bacterium]MCW5928971.1 serine hydrolase [Chitinophagaceae bacterium]